MSETVVNESVVNPTSPYDGTVTPDIVHDQEAIPSGENMDRPEKLSPEFDDSSPRRGPEKLSPEFDDSSPRRGPEKIKLQSSVKLPQLPKKPASKAAPWKYKSKLPLRLPEVPAERKQSLDIESVTSNRSSVSDRKSTASDKNSPASDRRSTASDHRSTASTRRSTAPDRKSTFLSTSSEKKIQIAGAEPVAESQDEARRRWSMLKRPPMLWNR